MIPTTDTNTRTAPAEIWNTYNNDVGRTREGRAALHAQGVNAALLKGWKDLPPHEHHRIRIILGLESATILAAAA